MYARIALPEHTEDLESTAGETDPVRSALACLAAYATTPGDGYAAIWEGWVSGDRAPKAPRVLIPHRTMLLFVAPVQALRNSPEVAWYGSGDYDLGQEPQLVWPADQAWCLACEVDEEIEFTVGCSEDGFQGLARALPGAVRRVQYGDPAPMYRDSE